jgi:hypothetical protein
MRSWNPWRQYQRRPNRRVRQADAVADGTERRARTASADDRPPCDMRFEPKDLARNDRGREVL